MGPVRCRSVSGSRRAATTAAEERLESILDLLRRRGGRVTRARREIVRALLESADHVSADDLAAAVQPQVPEVHQSTVYRCLEALERLGVVDHTHLGHGRAVYHLTDSEEEAHNHLVCEACGIVIEVPDALFGVFGTDLRSRYGFVIRPRHFAVLGRCRSCSGA